MIKDTAVENLGETECKFEKYQQFVVKCKNEHVKVENCCSKGHFTPRLITSIHYCHLSLHAKFWVFLKHTGKKTTIFVN